MKYYQLSHSTVTEEVGITYPQSQTARESLPIDHPQHLWQQKAGILNNVALPEPVVHSDAKLSDLLSTTSTWRLVMSSKLKVILEKYIKEGQCQFLEMKVHYLSEEYQYWMLNPLQFNMEVIDFATSKIWLCGAGNTKIREMEIKNLTDFEKNSQTFHMPERVSITSVSFVPNITSDFIQLRNAPSMFYVSETLRNELIKDGCTGISFRDCQRSDY
jgi:hypothetical protein